jgi:hypothetical protein
MPTADRPAAGRLRPTGTHRGASTAALLFHNLPRGRLHHWMQRALALQRTWLNGRARPRHGRDSGFDSRRPLHTVSLRVCFGTTAGHVSPSTRGGRDVRRRDAGVVQRDRRAGHRPCAGAQPQWNHSRCIAAVAQPVERRPEEPGVGGSNPSCGTNPWRPWPSLARAERRAAPKPARIPAGDRLMYSSDEGRSARQRS